MKTLLLGAGASKSYEDSPSGQRMPIAGDFFSTFEALPIYENPWVLKEALTTYIEANKGQDATTYLRSAVDLEELHSEIEERHRRDMEAGDQAAAAFSLRPYNELIFIFAAVVNSVQNGPVSQCHARIAKTLGPQDVIMTFNWDTLMDRALAVETGWKMDWGYGFLPRRVFRDGWQEPQQPRGNGYPKLLKLHGSTNWLTSYTVLQEGRTVLTQESPPDSVSVFEYASKPYDTYAGRYVEGYEPFAYGYYPPNLGDKGRTVQEGHILLRVRPKVPWKLEGAAGDSGLVSMPLIIPPVKKKTYDLFGTLFAGLWKEARLALEYADHIIIVGYSFPRTDHQSNRLFLDAFMKRRSVPRVTIIDPHPERVRDKFLLEFGIPDRKLEVRQEFFSKEFPIEGLLET